MHAPRAHRPLVNFERLCLDAEARGFRVHLTRGDERPPKFRIAVLTRDLIEIVALPVREDRGLEGTAGVLREYLASVRG